jgi:hypothetical protein
MTYDVATGTIQYRTKKQKGREVIQTFSARDWLARLSAHIPDKWEQMVHYYGWYSNRVRGERKKAQQSATASVPVPPPQTVSEADSDFKKETGSPAASAARRHWARLINRIALTGVRERVYEVDPLVCPQCSGKMRIISFIEDAAVIERILRHLGLWPAPARAPRAPPTAASQITLDYRVADEPVSYD